MMRETPDVARRRSEIQEMRTLLQKVRLRFSYASGVLISSVFALIRLLKLSMKFAILILLFQGNNDYELEQVPIFSP
jgi:hypothetical protein